MDEARLSIAKLLYAPFVCLDEGRNTPCANGGERDAIAEWTLSTTPCRRNGRPGWSQQPRCAK
jgi:hypothetical protein